MGCGHSVKGRLADAPIVRGEFVPLTRDDPARSMYVYRIMFSGSLGIHLIWKQLVMEESMECKRISPHRDARTTTTPRPP